MFIRAHEHDHNALQELMKDAQRYAETAMRKKGELRTVLFLSGVEGKGMFVPDDISDTRSKDAFAEMAKLICLAHGANATVLATEAWAKSAKIGEKLDLSKSISQDKDREEVVVFLGETRTGIEQSRMPIIRNINGKYLGLGAVTTIEADKAEGRFANFISPNIPDERTREMAREILRTKGVDI